MKPSYMHLSLPCTRGSNLQHLSKNEDLKAERIQEFLRLIGSCCEIMPHVLLWSFELPKGNQDWTRTELQELLKCSNNLFIASLFNIVNLMQNRSARFFSCQQPSIDCAVLGALFSLHLQAMRDIINILIRSSGRTLEGIPGNCVETLLLL